MPSRNDAKRSYDMGFISDLFIKKRKYDHIVSLGNNCEFSFQFFTNYGFVDANMFSWVYVGDWEKMREAVADVDGIFSEGISGPDWMYICNKYDIKFHGRASNRELFDENGKPVEAVVESDKAELRERVEHLKEKFKKVLNTDESKLYVLKDPKDTDFVLRMKATLDKVVRNGYDFLVVVTRDELQRYEGLVNEHIFVRAVEKFSPVAHVTSKKKADMRGWKKILREFGPSKIEKAKSKKFKFEEV